MTHICDGKSYTIYTRSYTCKHRLTFLLETLFHNKIRCVYSKINLLNQLVLVFGENSVRRKFRRRKFHSAKFPFGENTVRRIFHSAKIPFDENSVRRKFCWRKFRSAKFPFGKNSIRRKFRSAKIPSAKILSVKIPSAKTPDTLSYELCLFLPHQNTGAAYVMF